jgi:hypothetical protein
MDITAPIIAGHSLGGIALGSNAEPVIAQAYAEGRRVELSIHNNPGIHLHSYQIDKGLVTVNANERGDIVSISCQQPYKGTYESKLWPGMSIAQIKSATQKQLLTSSALVLDGELGVFFALPAPYDEYDYIRELPDELILEKIYVMPRNWRGY